MWRKSSNNGWVPPLGLNSAAVVKIGGDDTSRSQRFAGQLGNIIVLNNGDALKNSNINGAGGGTLFMGAYQLVKFTGAMVKGQIVFWDTLANNGQNDFEVSPTAAATTAFRAGVCLFTDAAASGRFGYIQIGGLAIMQYRAAVTSAVIGNIVVQTSLTAADVDAIADAGTTFATNTGAKTVVGIAYETPANASLLRVWMNQFGFYPNVSS